MISFKWVPCWNKKRKRGWDLMVRVWRVQVQIANCPSNEWEQKSGAFFERRKPGYRAHRFHWARSPFFGNVWLVTR